MAPTSTSDRVVGEDATPPDQLMRAELRRLWRLAAPSVVIQLSMLLQWTLTAAYVGRTLGATALTGVSLGNLSGNLGAESIIVGLLTAMDTLAPQAFGAKRYGDVGMLAQVSLCVCFCAVIPFCVLMMQLEPVLLLLRQPPESAALASLFLRGYVWALPPLLVLEIVRRFMIAQGVVTPFIAVSLAGLVLHPLFLWLFVTVLGGGFFGAPLAHCATQYSMLALTALYLRCYWSAHVVPETWPGWRPREALRKFLRPFLRLGLPGVLSMSEWWFWETTCFMAGELGETELAAHSVAYALIPLCFMVPLGITIGSSTRIAALLGAGDVAMAKKVRCWSLRAGAAWSLAAGLAIYGLRDPLISAFTTDEEVSARARSIWPLVSLFIWQDGLFGCQAGVLRGLGFQGRQSAAIVVALWLVGLPALYFVVFRGGFGLPGLWATLVPVYGFMNALLLFGHNFRVGWEDISLAAVETAAKGDEGGDDNVVGELAQLLYLREYVRTDLRFYHGTTLVPCVHNSDSSTPSQLCVFG